MFIESVTPLGRQSLGTKYNNYLVHYTLTEYMKYIIYGCRNTVFIGYCNSIIKFKPINTMNKQLI